MGGSNSHVPGSPTPMTDQNSPLENLRCCKMDREATLEDRSSESDLNVSSTSLVALEMMSYGEKEDPMEFRDAFMEVFCSDATLGTSLEDSSVSIARAAPDAPVDVSSEMENEVEAVVSTPMTRSRVKDIVIRRGPSNKRGRKSRRASK